MTMTNNDFYFSGNRPSEVAVVLLQMGGPYNQDLIKPFLINLFSDPDIIRLPFLIKPLQGFIARMITRKRLNFVKGNYQLIGGGSPIFQHTAGLTKNVFSTLQSMGLNIDVTFVMRYSEPRTAKVIPMLEQRGIKKIILFPLYPHYSESTSGSSYSDFMKYYNKKDASEIVTIKDWSHESFYLDWWVQQIRSELSALQSSPKPTKIVFSVHGLPKRYIDQGDPYYNSVKTAVDSIMSNFPNFDHTLAFQSKVGPIEWLRPYTVDAVNEIASKDVNLLFVPLGFVSDHIETLQEIDILYTDQAKDLGVETIKRAKVPNESETFAKNISNYLLPYIG